MMNIVTWLNGKKTIIGIIAKAILKLLGQLKPEAQPFADSLDGYVDLWIGLGLADKFRKIEIKK